MGSSCHTVDRQEVVFDDDKPWRLSSPRTGDDVRYGAHEFVLAPGRRLGRRLRPGMCRWCAPSTTRSRIDSVLVVAWGLQRVGEKGVPVRGGLVGGDGQRASGPLPDPLVEVVGLGDAELPHGELIENEQRRAAPPSQSVLQERSAWPPARSASSRLVWVNTRMTPSACGVAEGLGDVGLAHPHLGRGVRPTRLPVRRATTKRPRCPPSHRAMPTKHARESSNG